MARHKPMNLRNVFYQAHLWIGVILGLYFSMLGFSGSYLLFKLELRKLMKPEFYYVSVPKEPTRLSLDRLADVFHQAHPDIVEYSVLWPSNANESVNFKYLPVAARPNPYSPVESAPGERHDRQEFFVDPYTGGFLGEQIINGDLSYVLHNLHAHFLLESKGHTLNSYGVIFLLLLVISGLWLWWPSFSFFKRQFKQRTRFSFKSSFKRFLIELHNAVGFYVFLVLFVLVVTAIGFLWEKQTNAVVSSVLGSGGPTATVDVCSANATRLTLDQIYQSAIRAKPTLLVVQMNLGSSAPVVMMGVPSDHAVSARLTSLTLNPCDGSITKEVSPQTRPLANGFIGWLKPTHFGQWGPGFLFYFVKALWCLVGFSPAVLFVTGVLMYLNKRKVKQS